MAATLTAGTLLSAGTALGQSETVARTKESHPPRALPLTSFYDTPAPLPTGEPGQLIRSEPFHEYGLAFNVSAVRILYHSRSSHTNDVAVSGVVLVPHGTPPAGGWPVIAWAHDFVGVGRQCAPSLMRNVSAGPFLSMYVNLGYAVVATDYAGLGTGFPSAVLDMQSNALDVIYSVRAARAAVPQLGPRWVAMGESQGGLAALGVAEAESEMRDPNYLGSITISGAADAQEVWTRLAQGSSRRILVLAHTVKTLYPEFEWAGTHPSHTVPRGQSFPSDRC